MWRSLAAAAGLAAVTARGGAAQAQYPDTTRLAREVPELLRVSGVPGLSMAVVRAGRVVWSGAFGTVNDSADAPPRRRRPSSRRPRSASRSSPTWSCAWPTAASSTSTARCSSCWSIPGSRTTRATGGSRPAWCSRTPPGCRTGAATRFASGSIRARTTGTPAKASSSSRRRSSASPVDPSTRSPSARCSGRSG